MPRKRAKPLHSTPLASTGTGSDPTPSSVDDSDQPAPSLPFTVVGIGASAGGLEAFKEMLGALPVDTGMAYVLVPHLDPAHPSMLAGILGRATRIPVVEATDNLALTPDHIYVLPPGQNMVMAEGLLKLSPRERDRRLVRPIDLFLRSLAEAQLHRAIAVILSGTATDGTLGCEQIKAAGGITFAQDDTAEQNSMPKSAAAAGCVDFVLPPDEIARQIAEIGRHPYVVPTAAVPIEERDRRADLSGILDLLHNGRGVDFTHYKRNTLYRRITRRMVLQKLEGLPEYQRVLLKDPKELEALYQDILISVTSFFRNPESFEAIKAEVLPRLTGDRSRHNSVRIWVLGCSTGEEAYSMAISFAEFAESADRPLPVQIFASDLNDAGIEKARAGFYGKSIADDVSPARLRRFFTEVEDGYRISKAIRDMVIFASHNVLTDPPFSHIDLITCRNVLIYLDPVLQHRLIPVMHYALNPGGYLWLGSSETVGPHRELFDLLDPKHKIYARRPAQSQVSVRLHHGGHPGKPTAKRESPPMRETATGLLGHHREADRLLLSRYAPAGVLVDSELEILQFRGDTSRFLMPSPGRASLNLLKMLREGLLVGVRGALQKARRTEGPVREEGLRLVGPGTVREVSVEVIPVRGTSLSETSYLVLFEEPLRAGTKRPKARAPRGQSERGALEQENIRLTQELAATREYLQSVIEQHEAANEELQSANEEVQSSNEELQSINEELETSKEEIESSNEELATVNEELQTRNLELSHSNNDLLNLLASVQLAIVMLGPDLRIRRFTPAAEKLLNLIPTDIGRPITDIKLNLEVPDLEHQLLEVISTTQPTQQEARDRQGRWFSLRIRPYRTQANTIEGAVLIQVDVDELKLAEEAVRSGAERLRIVQDQAPIGIREVDLDGRYLRVNDRFCEITGYSREELLRLRFQDLTHPDDVQANEDAYRRTLSGELPFYRLEKRYRRKDGRTVWVELYGTVVHDAAGVPQFGVGFEHDISERKYSEQALLESEQRFRTLADTAPVLIWVNGLKGPEFVNRAFCEFFGLSDDDAASGYDWIAQIHPEDCEALKTDYAVTLAGRAGLDTSCRLRRADGDYRWLKLKGAPRFTTSGELLGYVGTGLDITDLKQAEYELREADRTKNEFLAMLAHELRNPLAPLRNVIHLLAQPSVQGASFDALRELMDRQIQTLARLIDDLLDISRITQGKLQVQPETVELGELLRRTVEAARPAIQAREQSLLLTRPPEPIYLPADPIRLEQAFGNLLTNASKFTPDGGRIELQVEARGAESGRGQVEVRVKDNGSGIDPRVLPTIFDPFTQGDRRLDRARGGLGLGLTLVKRLVELHGGTVAARSDGPGRGSEFIVRLPVPAKDALPAQPERRDERRRRAREARRILVVDDNVDAGDSLALLLRRIGHEVEVSHDGGAAVELAAVFRPEIVLLDVGLPGLDGYEVARALRQLEVTRGATLVGVSGYGQDEDRRRALEAGFDHYFTKPMDFGALQDLLRQQQKPARG
jgi:two-component system, chemotaxis family, CheB/CheR fusion protein